MSPHSTPRFPAALGGHDLRRTPVLHTDVLVIGGGIAGGAAALAAAESGCSVLILSKTELRETNTSYAQGGVAAVLAPGDSFALHVQDTLAVGAGLTDPDLCDSVVREGPSVISWLQQLNAEFDHQGSALQLGREGGHTVERVVHANGDATGLEMQRALTQSLKNHENIDIKTQAFVRDLQLNGDQVVGAVCLVGGMELAIQAGATILATGGAGQIYRETTNPIGACGDGVALAFRAGACLRDMEFVQFHPTTLYIAGASRFLISEVLRGAGGLLKDRNGKRFMTEVHPDAELAPRDVVSRAILDRMVETGDTHVYLDLCDVQGDPHQLFPSISRICQSFDINVAKDPVPVRPGAHYLIGGIETDNRGHSSLGGLLAAGEVACTGIHGANRLASNSLLEGAVMGRRAGQAAAETAHSRQLPLPRRSEVIELGDNPPRIHLDDMLYSLKSLMWRQVGLKRSREGVQEARERIAFWNHYLLRSGLQTAHGFELANMLTVSSLVAECALSREESRGTHFRADFRERDDEAWCLHQTVRRGADGGLSLEKSHPMTPSDQSVQR